MKFEKKAISQWVVHRCERQLGLNLWTDKERRDRKNLDLPHRQIKPGLQQMADAGEEWQAKKVADMLTAFGNEAVIGTLQTNPATDSAGHPTLAYYKPIPLADALSSAKQVTFIVEAEFDPINDTFAKEWDLGWRTDLGLAWASVRPDVIEVGAPGRFSKGLDASGQLVDLQDDTRTPLRVVDMKLSSEPGPGYFAEATYYSLALAAWLVDNNLDDRYAVAADAALWPGSFDASRLRDASQDGTDDKGLVAALHSDLEVVPTEVFVSELRRFFLEVLPRVASNAQSPEWRDRLKWHVVPSCAGCDFLGQAFPGVTKPGKDSEPHHNHCVPSAEAADHLSRLPFLPRGGTTVLQDRNIKKTAAVAETASSDEVFDEHHSLRAGRKIIPARAQALADPSKTRVPDSAGTDAIPKWSDLNIYITADFDPTSAITLAFGFSSFFYPSKFGQGAGKDPQRNQTRVYYVTSRDVEAEREQLRVFLTAIKDALDAAQKVDPDAELQIYLWDTLTFQHLTRVFGRHLDWLLSSGELANLAWLFPPEDLIGHAANPSVSVVKNAVQGVLATPQAHTYTLLATAKVYHRDSNFNTSWLRTPPYWTTQFSDQIPGERAFDLWTRRNLPNLPHSTLVENLNRTVRARHTALETVVQRLRTDLRGRLSRKAPKIKKLTPPGFVAGSSLLGSLLYSHSQLNAAAAWQEAAQVRALAPHEREARFAAIRCEKRLIGNEREEAAADLDVDLVPGVEIYRTMPGSAEAKVEVGDFTWAISPESRPGLLDRSLYADKETLASRSWWGKKNPWDRTYADALSVSVLAFDRQNHMMALALKNPDAAADMKATGLVDLSENCIVDRIEIDFLSGKVKKAVKAIGNPPKAAAEEAEIRQALGVTTRGPRQTGPNPVEDLLWDPKPLHSASVDRNTTGLREELEKSESFSTTAINPHQWGAWEHALTRRLTLIWGPPGTGKSTTIRLIVEGLISSARRTDKPLRILITAGTYTAIDNVLEEIADQHSSTSSVYRVRSDSQPPKSWAVESGVDTSVEDAQKFGQLTQQLRSPDSAVVVAATPQQTQKIITAVTDGPESGEVFDYILVDEGGQLDVAHTVLALSGIAAGGQLAVAGDPLQLPPIHHVAPPTKLETSVGPIYSYYKDKHDVPEEVLLTNYRSNDAIVGLARFAGYPAKFVSNSPSSRIARGDESSSAPPGWPSSISWNTDYWQIVDPDRPVVCVSYPEGTAGQWNRFEADLAVGLTALLAHHLSSHGITDQDLWNQGLGVVTPHRAQRSLIITGLTAAFPESGRAIPGAVDTVERFQGQERDAILASYAVGDPDTVAEEDEFLQNLNRFNVLATRPKHKLVVLVSDEVLTHVANDIEVIHGSRLLKAFASSYCNNNTALRSKWTDPLHRETPIELTVRWR